MDVEYYNTEKGIAEFSRPLREQVFELRPSNSAGQHRVTYCFWNEKTLLLSEFPKKTQQTPDKEIEKAVKRKRDWILRYGNGKQKNMNQKQK